MNPNNVAPVQQSFKKVAAMGQPELFYAELFAIDPSLRQMFKADMSEQRKKLLAALAMVIGSLHAPERIANAAKALATKHVGYGVMPVHYTYVGNALLRTLKKGLREDFTPEVRDAWVEAYGMLARVVKEAAYPQQLAKTKGVSGTEPGRMRIAVAPDDAPSGGPTRCY
jgi:hemoglobin-like flavoprotein